MSRRRAPSPQHDANSSDSAQEGAGPSAQAVKSVVLPKPHDSLRHLFLQAFITHRLLPHAQAKLMYKECVKVCQVRDADSFEDFVAGLEPQLSLLGLELKGGSDQESGVPFLALVNTISDSMAKLATELSAAQLVFFRLVVDKIMTAPKMKYAVTVKEASKCAKDKSIVPSMTFVQAEALLKSLTFKGWLTYNPGRWLTLAPRSVAELAPYLREKYAPDEEEENLTQEERGYVECQQCRTIVTSGWACPNEACSVRLHRHCASGGLTGRNGKCAASINDDSACQELWHGSGPNKWSGTPVGLLALQDADDDQDQLASDDDDEEEEEEPATQSQTQTRQRPTQSTPGRSAPARETATPATSTRRSRAAPTSTAESEDDVGPSKRSKRGMRVQSSSDASDDDD